MDFTQLIPVLAAPLSGLLVAAAHKADGVQFEVKSKTGLVLALGLVGFLVNVGLAFANGTLGQVDQATWENGAKILIEVVALVLTGLTAFILRPKPPKV